MSERKKRSREEAASPGECIRTLLSAAIALSSTSLDLRSRQLSRLCTEFVLLHRLEYLYLEGNLLKEVPAQVVQGWRSLRWLDLRNNLLVGLPSTIGELRNLRTLLLAGNKIGQLPLELGHLSKLTGLNLSGNPLSDPPRSVVEQGTRQVLSYLLKKHSESQFSPIPDFLPRRAIPLLVHPDRRAYPSEYPEDDGGESAEMPPELTLRRAKLFAMRGMRNPVPKRFPSPANFALYPGPVKSKMSSFAPKKKSILKKPVKELPPLAYKPDKRSLMEIINETAPSLPPNPPNTQQRLTGAAPRLGDPASQARLVLNENKTATLRYDDEPIPGNMACVPAQNMQSDARVEPGVERAANVRANRPKEARLRREVKQTGAGGPYEDKGYSLTPFTGGLDII